jgi:hypothetical protein
MEPTESSEMSAFSTWTPGRDPKENAVQMKHGESLKSRSVQLSPLTKNMHSSNVILKLYHFLLCGCLKWSDDIQ